MVPPYNAAARIGRAVVCRKRPEPTPLFSSVGIFTLQSMRKFDAAGMFCTIQLKQSPGLLYLPLHGQVAW